MFPEFAVVGEDADDTVVGEEDPESFLMLHGPDDIVSLIEEVGQFGFGGGPVDSIAEILFGVFREHVAARQFGEVEGVDFLVSECFDGAGVHPEEGDCLLGEFFLCDFLLEFFFPADFFFGLERFAYFLLHFLHCSEPVVEERATEFRELADDVVLKKQT